MGWSLRCTLLVAVLASAAFQLTLSTDHGGKVLLEGNGADLQDETDVAGRFVKFFLRRTTTSFSIVSSTTTVPFTCISTVDTATTCTGRRKRRKKRTAVATTGHDLPALSGLTPEVQSSIRTEAEGTDNAPDQENRLLTSWSTFTTIITSVSTVTTFGVSVSLSVACTIGGVNFAPLC
ncbi:uncharacterized protein LOC119103515 [Pollicipes pollicipes]|uniref:uncharacterized protein LOC119103515 n=1 Tax=Pollicipes pollicipes TaxID=41117 RepID=UPI001884C8B9|nr:uncharacterized protein LOC119103515 [Pollicipes pollicipes]